MFVKLCMTTFRKLFVLQCIWLFAISAVNLYKFYREHEVKQRAAEVKIASKLVSEEEQFRRRKQMYPHLWQEKRWEEAKVCC